MVEMGRGAAMSLLAARGPQRPAVRCEGTVVTRAELDRRANQLARAYASFGVRHDDLVAIVLPNGIEFYAATLAVWKLGATPLPVSWRLPDAELGPIIDVADPALVVGIDPTRAPGRATVPPGFVPEPRLDDRPLPAAVARYGRALTSGGSTGRPKVIVSHEPSVIDPDAPALGMRADGVHLVPGPLFHNAPFTTSLTGLLHGATLVVMTRFDPSEALALIERHRVTWVQVVPTMLARIWRLPEAERAGRDLSSLQVVFSTGGAFPAWLKEAWSDWIGDDRIVEIYGSSEAYGSTVVTGAEARRKPGTVGRPRFGPPRVLDPDDPTGPPLGPNQVGLLAFARPAEPTYHYLGAEPIVYNGWETLGDIGYVDEDGYVFLVDRRVDMIVTGGENVFPAEVEQALERHPSVRTAVVIGLPDDDLGQRLHAIVDVGHDWTDGPAVDEPGLRVYLHEQLDRYKVPRTFEFVTEPLRSDAGKVRRSQLRDERVTAVRPPARPA